MPFGLLTGLGPRKSVLRGGDDLQKGRRNFWGKRGRLAWHAYELQIGPVHAAACTRQGQMLDSKHWTSLLSAAKGGDCTPRAKSDICDCLVRYNWKEHG